MFQTNKKPYHNDKAVSIFLSGVYITPRSAQIQAKKHHDAPFFLLGLERSFLAPTPNLALSFS